MNYTKGELNYEPKGWEQCGCHIREEPLWSAQIEYCPKHKAAPAMYEALKLWRAHQQNTYGHYCGDCAKPLEQALAKADGRE